MGFALCLCITKAKLAIKDDIKILAVKGTKQAWKSIL
jgi:hypothetical protein